jgi:hypothetical protein
MAGEGTIGAIRVILGADTAKFEENLRSATGSLQSFAKDVAKVAAGIGIGITAEKAFGQVVESINQAIDAADKLSKASQKFGISTDNLQVLAHQAALSDVSLDQLGSSIAKLSKNMIAAEGPTSDQAAAFKALGLSVSELIKLSPDQAFLKIADAISKYGDGTTKTAAVQAIFGKGAANLIPILNQGSAGFNEMKSRMEDLGQIMSGPAITAAEHYKDSLNDLQKAKDALVITILGDSGLLDALTRASEAFLRASASSKSFQEQTGIMVPSVAATRKEIDFLSAALEVARAKFKELGESAVVVDDFGRVISGAATAAGKDFANLGVSVDDFIQRSSKITASAKEYVEMAVGMKAVAEAAKQFAPQLIFSPEANKNAEAFNKQLDKIHAQALEVSGVFAGQLAPGFLTAAAGADVLKGQFAVVGDQITKMGPDAQRLNDALLELEARKIHVENLTPLDVMKQKIDAATLAFQAGKLSAADFELQVEKSQRAVAGTFLSTFDQIGKNVADTFALMARKNKEYAGLAKATAIGEATIGTALGIVRALDAPFGLGPILAASVAALGAAQIATISATQFAKGGSFRVPGGVSGIDNHLIPLALSSGEQVDITPAHQAGGGGRVVEINMSGLEDTALYSGKRLRNLVESLNQGHRDGYRLKLGGR